MPRIFGLLLIMIAFVSACSSPAETVSELEGPEADYAASPNPSSASRLTQSIVGFIQNNPELESSQKVSLLNRAFEVSKEQKMWQQAANFLNTILRDEKSTKEIEIKAQELVTIIENMNNQDATASLKLAFKKAFPTNTANVNFKVNSSIEDPDIDSRITRLGNSMFNDSTHQFNERAATLFIDACEAHALLMPEQESSIEYLHKAGETSRSIRSFRKAISVYDWIYSRYPNDPRSSQALFLKAFTYDNDLRDLTTAKALYEEYLEKYPTDDFSDDTQFLLKNLGKSDEEILKELSQENQ